MFWPQGSQREHPFMAGAAHGWWRPARLGQIPSEGMFLGPMNVYSQMPAGYFAAQSGRPLMAPELTSPQAEHIARTFHCYVRNGEYRAAPFAARDVLKAQGWEETDYANCAGAGVPLASPVGAAAGRALYGRRRVGQQVQVTAPSGAPVATVAATPSGGTSIFVEPAIYGVPIVPVLLVMAAAAAVFAATRND